MNSKHYFGVPYCNYSNGLQNLILIVKAMNQEVSRPQSTEELVLHSMQKRRGTFQAPKSTANESCVGSVERVVVRKLWPVLFKSGWPLRVAWGSWLMA